MVPAEVAPREVANGAIQIPTIGSLSQSESQFLRNRRGQRAPCDVCDVQRIGFLPFPLIDAERSEQSQGILW